MDGPEPSPLLWTIEETARALAVTPNVVRNLHRYRQLPGVKVGRALRWRPEDVARYVEGLAAAS